MDFVKLEPAICALVVQIAVMIGMHFGTTLDANMQLTISSVTMAVLGLIVRSLVKPTAK